MCGRFTLKTPPEQWVQALLPLTDLSAVSSAWKPRYNIAPTQNIIAIAATEGAMHWAADYFRWGLLPGWATDLSIGNRMINARAETLAEKRSFKGPLERRRCWYWRTVIMNGNGRQMVASSPTGSLRSTSRSCYSRACGSPTRGPRAKPSAPVRSSPRPPIQAYVRFMIACPPYSSRRLPQNGWLKLARRARLKPCCAQLKKSA